MIKSEVNNEIKIIRDKGNLILYYPALIDLVSFKIAKENKIVVIRKAFEKRERLLEAWNLREQKIELYENLYRKEDLYNFLIKDLWEKVDMHYLFRIIKEKNIQNIFTYYRYQYLLKELKYLKKRIFMFDSFSREFMNYQYYNIGGYLKEEEKAVERYTNSSRWIEEIGNRIEGAGKKEIRIVYVMISEGKMYVGLNNVIREYQDRLQSENRYGYMGLDLGYWQSITEEILRDIKTDYVFYSFMREVDKEKWGGFEEGLECKERIYEIPYGMGSWEHNTLESNYLFIWMSKIIYKELLKDLDLKDLLKSHYKEVYGLEVEEETMKEILQIRSNKDKENYDQFE